MRKSILLVLLLAGSIAAMAVAIADLTGKWTGAVIGPDGNNYPLTCNFKADGNKLTGTQETSFGTSAIEDGIINGDNISFSTSVNGVKVANKGKVYADSIALDATYNDMQLHATLKKVKP